LSAADSNRRHFANVTIIAIVVSTSEVSG